MKKSVKILAIVLTLVMLCTVLASCGKKLSGDYSADAWGTGMILRFDGGFMSDEVSLVFTVLGEEVGDGIKGTYKIEDDKITFDFDENKEAEEFEGTFDFEEGDDYIKIGKFGKFTKVEK